MTPLVRLEKSLALVGAETARVKDYAGRRGFVCCTPTTPESPLGGQSDSRKVNVVGVDLCEVFRLTVTGVV